MANKAKAKEAIVVDEANAADKTYEADEVDDANKTVEMRSIKPTEST